MEVEQGNKDEIEEQVEVIVPNVTGKSLTEAIKVLKEQGFTTKINNETEELNKDETTVKSQTPSAEIKAIQGSCVYLN